MSRNGFVPALIVILAVGLFLAGCAQGALTTPSKPAQTSARTTSPNGIPAVPPGSVPAATVTVSPTGGPSGTSLTATGSGFAAYETSITVTFDGKPVNSGITASSTGAWDCTFVVPPTASGAYPIHAYGFTTPSTSDLIFKVTPAVSISRSGGVPGSSLDVTGVSFAASERNITLTYDGATLASDIQADATGAWSYTFVVPDSVSGSHPIAVSGPVTQTISMTFTAVADFSLSRTSGAVGAPVTITGKGFAFGETPVSVTYDGAQVAANVTANDKGVWTVNWIVPPSPRGPHSIFARSPGFATTHDVTFTVNAAVSVDQTSGASGDPITVTGTGFGASEKGITVTYDGAPIASGAIGDANGSWNVTITIPASSAGRHSLHAYGSTTPAAATPDIAFNVGSGIVLSQARGRPGSSLTVTGSGSAAQETGITVSFDGVPVGPGVTASATGAWSNAFTVPLAPSGAHSIRAYGPNTTSIPDVTFNVTPSVTANRPGGIPGTSLTIAGSGFAANESGIAVTYDLGAVARGISANSQGSWAIDIVIPPSPAGPHNIHVYGPATPAAATSDITFVVKAGILLSRTSGAPGSSLTVAGAGFNAYEPGITVTFDGVPLGPSMAASSTGAWSNTFAVPATSPGAHAVAASSPVTPPVSVTFTVVAN